MENWNEVSQLSIEIFSCSPWNSKFLSEEDKATYLAELSAIQWRFLSREKRKEAINKQNSN